VDIGKAARVPGRQPGTSKPATAGPNVAASGAFSVENFLNFLRMKQIQPAI